MKKIRRVLAIAMALAVLGTTNLGGFENVLIAEAATDTEISPDLAAGINNWAEKGKYDVTIDNKTTKWIVYESTTSRYGVLYMAKIYSGETNEIVVPTYINGFKITVFGGIYGKDKIDAKSITIPEKITILPDAMSGCKIKDAYVYSKNCSDVFKNCRIENLVLYGVETFGFSYDAEEEVSKALKTVIIRNTDSIYLQKSAFSGCKNLESLSVEDSVGTCTIAPYAFDNCEKLKSIESKAQNVTLNTASFSDCDGLENVMFDSEVKINAIQDSGTGGINAGGAFYSCFEKKEDSEGEIINKTLTFNKNIRVLCNNAMGDSTSSNGYKTSVIEYCDGLTDVIFNGDVYMDTSNFFLGCDNLSNIEFNGSHNTLGDAEFANLSALKKLQFKGFTMGVTSSSEPFDNCNVELLVFEDNVRNLTISNMYNLKTIYFGNGVGYYGRYGEIYVTLRNLSSNLNFIFNTDYTNPSLETASVYMKSKLLTPPNVYGYGASNSGQNYVKNWAETNNEYGRKNGNFYNIIGEVNTFYDYGDNKESVIGEVKDGVFSAEKDASKIVVKAKYLEKVNDVLKEIGYQKENYDSKTGEITLLPQTNSNIENSGYVIEKIPEDLKEGTNHYTVTYSNIAATGKIEAENLKATSMTVDWNEQAIADMVSGQQITVNDVVSGAAVTFNDGIIRNVNCENLTIDKTVLTNGDNIFTVGLKGIDCSSNFYPVQKTFSIQENYVVSMSAIYVDKDENGKDRTYYVGDKIDPGKIVITPSYKCDKDSTVNRKITNIHLDTTELVYLGENKIKVTYNDGKHDDVCTYVTINAEEVKPVKVYASFDSAHYSYISGQTEIDLKSIVAMIEYNNGTKKTGAEIGYDFKIDVKVKNEDKVTATISYQGIESEAFTIDVDAKVIQSISFTSSLTSATEGTKLTPNAITGITVTYNNGIIEELDASSINYSTLTFGEYEIVANQINKIPVNYNGASGTIEVFGVSNAITSIYAEYIGKGLTVGSVLTIDDISVHAVNTNGQITDIKDGVLIENGIIYNVGENTVTLHYGSLSCTIVVTGVAATDITKTPEPAKDKPVAMETPVPVATSEPVVTVSTGGTVNSNPTIQTSDIPSSVVNVATSSMVVSSNIIGIKLTDKVEYKVLTNKNVVITIIPGNATNIKYQVVKKGTNVSDTAWKVVADNKITVKSAAKPSVVYIQYTDINGVVQTALTTGFTIDKKKAAVNVKSGKTYKKGKKITFKDANGIKIAKLDGKVIKTGKKVIKKGSHTLVVTDKAGNKKTVKFKIK